MTIGTSRNDPQTAIQKEPQPTSVVPSWTIPSAAGP